MEATFSEPLTVEDFLIALETDHGYAQGFGYFFSKSSHSACAYGNAAIDIAKRTGQPIDLPTIDTIANRLSEHFVDHIPQSFDSVDIIIMNDEKHLSFHDIGRNVREFLEFYHISRDTSLGNLNDFIVQRPTEE